MREVLFRVRDNGHWYYGLPLRISENNVQFSGIDENDKDIYSMFNEKATLGQFTGLCDKYGKRIFEGDIVRCDTALYKNVEGIIKYSENACCFYVNAFGSSDDYLLNCEDIVVVANIHDNPELVGGKE